jgi:transcriptional regulator with XRE-family HTH domain
MNGQKLRDIRKKSGKTLRQISFESDVTESQIIQIENGTTKSPKIDTLMNLAKALDCDIKDFLD